MPSVRAIVEVDAVTEDSALTDRVGRAAITAGSIKRAYLKGRRDAMGCVQPVEASASALAAESTPASAVSSPNAKEASKPPAPTP